jgi:N-acyl-D-aspartate/D-glutamate deacylase
MNGGAIGISTGLYYAPGSYANRRGHRTRQDRRAHGGIYDTHMRDESSYTIGLLASVRETIRIGREAHIPVMISHIKALGADVWGQSTRSSPSSTRAQVRPQRHRQPVPLHRLRHQRHRLARPALGRGRRQARPEPRRPRLHDRSSRR